MKMIRPQFLPLPGLTASWCLVCLLLLAFTQQVASQIVVRTLLTDCAPPDTPQQLAVEIRLEPGDSLKVYDVRLCFDTTRVQLDESQIQQGEWFSNAGPTFFWHQYHEGELIVTSAILGPGLAVTGYGTIFTLPLSFTLTGITASDISQVVLYNAQAVPYTSVVTVPANVQVPCPD